MTGGGKPKFRAPEELSPAPTPLAQPEMEEAKKKVRRRARRGGRESTRLAGRMMSERNDTSILKTKLG